MRLLTFYIAQISSIDVETDGDAVLGIYKRFRVVGVEGIERGDELMEKMAWKGWRMSAESNESFPDEFSMESASSSRCSIVS
jgi:hypothetical protein